MRAKPWEVPDGLWERIEPLLPARQRRFRYPGRKPLDDRRVLQGILFVLHTGIGWEHLPQELGFGCGMTAWRRLRVWQQAGVWERLHGERPKVCVCGLAVLCESVLEVGVEGGEAFVPAGHGAFPVGLVVSDREVDELAS